MFVFSLVFQILEQIISQQEGELIQDEQHIHLPTDTHNQETQTSEWLYSGRSYHSKPPSRSQLDSLSQRQRSNYQGNELLNGMLDNSLSALTFTEVTANSEMERSVVEMGRGGGGGGGWEGTTESGIAKSRPSLPLHSIRTGADHIRTYICTHSVYIRTHIIYCK